MELRIGGTLIREAYGPTTSMIFKKVDLLETSTETHRFDFLRSIVSKRALAAGFVCLAALSP